MAKVKSRTKKIKLAKCNTHTRWAPFWIIPRIYGLGRRVHPGRHTEKKRSWRRIKLKRV